MITWPMEVIKHISFDSKVVKYERKRCEQGNNWLHANKKCSKYASFDQKNILVSNIESVVSIILIKLFLTKHMKPSIGVAFPPSHEPEPILIRIK